jgi:hypothetical protein
MFGLTKSLWCISSTEMGSFIVKQVNLKCIFYLSTQIIFLQILFMFKGDQDSIGCIVTHYRLDSLWFKLWWGQDFLGPHSLLYNGYQVCFLGMKWVGHDADHILLQSISRAIPLLPLCACLACNGTAFTFIYTEIPYKHTTMRPRPLKIHAMGPWPSWSDIDICKISLKCYKGFQCHKMSVLQLHLPLSISSVTVAA